MNGWDELTPREREVLYALVNTDGTREAIAELVYMSPQTVKWHLQNILRKTGCRTRLELAVAYVRASETQGSEVA